MRESEQVLSNASNVCLPSSSACPPLTHVHACARRWLTLEDTQARVLTELRHYAKVAWSFLHAAGYINFGVAPAISKRALGAQQEHGSVIIVGAGLAGLCSHSLRLFSWLVGSPCRLSATHWGGCRMHAAHACWMVAMLLFLFGEDDPRTQERAACGAAGLAAARQLRASGHRVLILEGHGRPGGRVYTRRLEARFSRPPFHQHPCCSAMAEPACCALPRHQKCSMPCYSSDARRGACAGRGLQRSGRSGRQHYHGHRRQPAGCAGCTGLSMLHGCAAPSVF